MASEFSATDRKSAPRPVRHPGGPAVVTIVAALLVVGLGYLLWPAANPDQLAREAREAVESKSYDRALALSDQIGRLRTPTPDDLMTRSWAESGLKRADTAVATLDQIPDADPLASTARLLAGQIELRRQHLASAEAHLLRAVALDPKRVQALRELVYIFGMQLRRAELSRTFRALSKQVVLEPNDVYLWTLSRGVTWEPDEVVEYLTTCVAADPSDRYSRLGLAENLRQQNRLAEAEKVLAPLPASDVEARVIRVRIALDRSDDAAIDALLADAPADQYDLALLRGRLALARGEAAAAIEAFRLAYRLDPTTREANQGLGQALTLAGDPAAAAPYLDTLPKFDRLQVLMQRASVSKNRNDVSLIRDLGEACLAVGRRPEAHAWYRLAVRADPSDTRAQQGAFESSDPEPSDTSPTG